MSWYNNHKQEWKEIIETISIESAKTFYMIEKDTLQSMFLYKLMESGFPFVFKGGTSLSKAFKLIERFSEDIDISSSKKLTASERKLSNTIILNTAQKLGLELSNEQEIKSRYEYNKYIFQYYSLLDNSKLEILVETNYYQPVYPIVLCNINSLIGTYSEENNIVLPIPFPESKFTMSVQSLERTFIDKVFAVCDYKIQNMMDRDSRHLYDIAKIFPQIEINNYTKAFIQQVRLDRANSKSNPSADPKYNINKLLEEIIITRFFESDYNFLTTKLLYENYSYDEAIFNGIKKVKDLNIF